MVASFLAALRAADLKKTRWKLRSLMGPESSFETYNNSTERLIGAYNGYNPSYPFRRPFIGFTTPFLNYELLGANLVRILHPFGVKMCGKVVKVRYYFAGMVWYGLGLPPTQ